MKIGDEVVSKYDFTIVRRIGETFTVSFRTESGPYFWDIPIYIGTFGIKLREFSFHTPGVYKEDVHPDSYLKRNSNFVDMRGREFTLRLDEGFHVTGKYYLDFLDTKFPNEIRFAQLKSKFQWEEEVNSWVHLENLDPHMINGIIVRIIYQEMTSANIAEDEMAYAPSLAYAREHHAVAPTGIKWTPPPILIVIQDKFSYIEYALPENLLTKIV